MSHDSQVISNRQRAERAATYALSGLIINPQYVSIVTDQFPPDYVEDTGIKVGYYPKDFSGVVGFQLVAWNDITEQWEDLGDPFAPLGTDVDLDFRWNAQKTASTDYTLQESDINKIVLINNVNDGNNVIIPHSINTDIQPLRPIRLIKATEEPFNINPQSTTEGTVVIQSLNDRTSFGDLWSMVDLWRSPTGDIWYALWYDESGLTFSDSIEQIGNEVSLDGDIASPGPHRYYGTQGAGSKSFFPLQDSSGSIVWTGNTGARLIGDALSPGSDQYWGTNAVGSKGFFSLPDVEIPDSVKELYDQNSTAQNVTVGAGGDFNTLNEAIEYASELSPKFKGTTNPQELRITILSGHVLSEQIFLEGIDLRHVIIESQDATVTIQRSALSSQGNLPPFGGDVAIPTNPAFMQGVSSFFPVINFKAQMDTSGSGLKIGYKPLHGSTLIFRQGAGMANTTGHNLFSWGTNYLVLNEGDFSDATQTGIWIEAGGIVDVQDVTATGCNVNFFLRNGCIGNVRNSDFTGASSIGCQVRGSYLHLRNSDTLKNPSTMSTSDMVVERGGIIAAYGTKGGQNIFPNATLAEGCIMREYPLGSLSYNPDNSSGILTGTDGGGVWERHANGFQMVTTPPLNITATVQIGTTGNYQSDNLVSGEQVQYTFPVSFSSGSTDPVAVPGGSSNAVEIPVITNLTDNDVTIGMIKIGSEETGGESQFAIVTGRYNENEEIPGSPDYRYGNTPP